MPEIQLPTHSQVEGIAVKVDLVNDNVDASNALIATANTKVATIDTRTATMSSTLGTVHNTVNTINARGSVKNVQRGVLNLPKAAFGTTTINIGAVVLAKSLLIVTYSVTYDQGNLHLTQFISGALLSNSITFTQALQGSMDSIVHWQVVEYY